MQPVVLSGIRPSFPGLSQSAGQITHVLLTRSPLEHPRKGLSVRLACVKHAASVRPEPESNSPNKNPNKGQNSNQKQSDQSNQTPKTGIKKHHTPKREKRGMAKNNNKQKPPNTLLSSQTTHPPGRATSPRQLPRTRSADGQEPTEVGLPSGTPSRSAGWPRRDDFNKLREGKLGVKWPDRACLSIQHLSRAQECVDSDHIIQRARRRQYSACPDAAPASGRAGSPTAAAPTPRSRSARC